MGQSGMTFGLALYDDLRMLKKLWTGAISDERSAMIEKGMEPPPMEEHSAMGALAKTPQQRRERSLHSGVTSIMLGLGLGVAAWVMNSVLTHTFIPPGIAGPLAIGAIVLVFLGLGNLIYYAVSRGKPEEEAR